MLGLSEAVKTYNNNPADPYVVLSSKLSDTGNGQDIEVRFSEDGLITAAYMVEMLEGQRHSKKWGSDEFIKNLIEQNRRATVDELPRKEEVRNRPQAQPQIPRQKKRIRLDALRDL